MKLPKENYFEVFVTNIQRQTIGPNIISHEKTLLCVKYWNVYYIEKFLLVVVVVTGQIGGLIIYSFIIGRIIIAL